jgi:KAP family P-loop domain
VEQAMTPEDEASPTTINLSGFSMEPHVQEAFNLAWSNSAGKPLSAAHLLSAAVAVGGSEAFRELKERTPGWRVPASGQPGPKGPRPPSLDLTAVPVETHLDRSFAIAEPFLSRGDRRIWGRDFVCLALWSPDDPALIKVIEAAGIDYGELRKGWLRFLLDSDIHRSALEWQQWFEASDDVTVNAEPPKDLPTPEREHVRLLVDETVGLDEDELGRRAIAEVLKDQLSRLLADFPGRSFLVHVDGAWGAGKSTILRFLHESIERSHGEGSSGATSTGDWLVVTYDAWRQARVGPPWLTVLQALRKMVRSEQPTVLRPWFWFQERRQLVTKWQRVAAVLMLLALIGLVLLVVRAGPDLSLTSFGDLVKGLGALVSVGAALWLIISWVGRFVTLDSRRSARTFLETRADPMEDLTSHFDWVLEQAGKPVLLLIDDLDRCPETFVVELLDSIQKLMRDPDPIHGAAVSDRRAVPLMVVVAADGRWLRSSYDNTYASLASAVKEPGATIGSLFLEKIFQLSVPVPTLSDDLRSAYLASMLAETPGPSPLMAGSSTELVKQLHEAAPEDRLGVLAAATPIERVKAAPDAVRLLVVDDRARAVTSHALEQYAELLDPTPRAMKRFVMEYFMLRAVRTAEGSVVKRGPLALWTIVLTRWPLLAEFLRNSPPSVQLFGSSPTQIPSSVPADLIDLFLDPPQDLRNVMNHPHGPLDAKRIREASGQAMVTPR